MLVYRIALDKYAGALVASGVPARWNSRDIKMIYTASTRALACLENIVHRTALGLQSSFRTMVIELPPTVSIKTIAKEALPDDWHLFENYPQTQAIGDNWVSENKTAVLQIPSAIVTEEWNYLLNPAHKEFNKIRILRTEPFVFDPRIKGE